MKEIPLVNDPVTVTVPGNANRSSSNVALSIRLLLFLSSKFFKDNLEKTVYVLVSIGVPNVPNTNCGVVDIVVIVPIILLSSSSRGAVISFVTKILGAISSVVPS